MTVKDGTSVLNQSEQAVSQPGCSYPAEPRSRKQDFAVDSHYWLHFAYNSPGADPPRFICLISCTSLLFWLCKFVRHLSERFSRVRNSPWIRFDAFSGTLHLVRYIDAFPMYFIDRDFKGFVDTNQSASCKQQLPTVYPICISNT